MGVRLCFMMHSVLDVREWDYSELVTSGEELEMLVAFFMRLGFTFVKARDYFASHGNCVCLTFDDGYADNWTMLYPRMAKKAIPYTVFVSRDFVEPTEDVRPFGDTRPGYLSLGELRRMHESGLVDVQSHSVTHTWYPTSTKIVDIFDPGSKARYPWLFWNRSPERKVEWLRSSYHAFDGFPVFEHDRSLRARRYVFDPDMRAHFERRVVAERLSPVDATALITGEYRTMARPETPEEQRDRYTEEIAGNAQFIKDTIGCFPSVFCWPGGAFASVSREIAYEYHTVTTIKQGYGRDRRCLHRISPVNPYGRDRIPWKYQSLTLSYYAIRHVLRQILSRPLPRCS